jgi:hypothetical protein
MHVGPCFQSEKNIIEDFEGFNMHPDINSKMVYWKKYEN